MRAPFNDGKFDDLDRDSSCRTHYSTCHFHSHGYNSGVIALIDDNTGLVIYPADTLRKIKSLLRQNDVIWT